MGKVDVGINEHGGPPWETLNREYLFLQCHLVKALDT